MPRYPEEIKDFINNNVNGMYVHDLVEKINRRFGTNYTYSQIRSYKKNHNLKSNVPTNSRKGNILFTKEIEKFMSDNITGTSVEDLTRKVNETFETSYTTEQIRSYKSRKGLKNDISTQFKKGHISHNKGKKGIYALGSEKGWFKKGRVSQNQNR
ncbi:MAG: hypothetical protein H9893_06265 [Candidatus Niameybacter stercoravium]|nr:hypothetical protein [Candidatus Niameybacter stercoravium]